MDTPGPARRNGGKRYRSASLENSGPESTSCRVKLECPERSTIGADDLLLKETKLCIGRFFYENGLDFSAVDSVSFHSMISLFSRRGPKYQVPTVEELKGWIFNDLMKEMHKYVDGVKKSWSETGCSILLDGWEDANGRSLVNILVDCPKGTVYLRSYDISDCVKNLDKMQSFFVTVLAEVGIENVVQIITYSSSSFMREAGKQLMERYRPIFWTVSASYCIELMLEKIRGIDEIDKTLEKAKTIARFVHSNPIALKNLQLQSNGSGLIDSSKRKSIRPFLAVENIVMEKETLVNLFLSTHPQALILTSESEGRKVANLMADCSFWSGASTVLKGAIPLVRVIEWISESEKDLMGNIYETIDQVKETIKDEFKNKESSYTPFWNVIDEVWNEFLYSPLHSAGYYLNPKIFYSSDVFIDPEVVTGLLCCIVRSNADPRMQDRITVQMEHYRISKGAMAEGIPEDRRSISPGENNHFLSLSHAILSI